MSGRTTLGDCHRFVLRFFLIFYLLTNGCAAESEQIELTPFDDLIWPEISGVPACDPWKDGNFEPPVLQPSRGSIQLEPSTSLIPLNTTERVLVTVIGPGDKIDSRATGQLEIVVGQGVEVVSSDAVSAGVAELVLRFSAEGVHRIEVFLADGRRRGTVEIEAYKSQLPIWQFETDPDAFHHMLDNPEERIEIAGVLVVDDIRSQTTARIHGGSSRYFPKKSFRFEVGEDSPGKQTQKMIARAEYNDKTMLRTWLGYEYFRNGTLVPTPDTEYIHLRINQRYYGLMHQVERIDEHFLKAHGLGENGNLYEADPPLELSAPGGNLTPLASDEDYYNVYQWHNGPGAFTDLIDLIEFTLQIPDRLFNEVLTEVVNVESYVRYLAMMAVLQNHEHIRKNYYLYRNPDGLDDRWIAIPWDLDLTMGHLWSETDDVFDERIISNGDLFVGELAPERFGYFNQLADRVLAQPTLRRRFLEIVAYLVENVVTEKFTASRLAYARCMITPDLLADQTKWAHDGEYLQRVDEIEDFWSERRSYIKSELAEYGID